MSDAVKILIADDEPECVDFVRETFAGTPYEIISAGDGEEALRAAREQSPRLIILDIQMPKRDGFEVFKELRADERLSSVPVIMLTAVTARTGIRFSGSEMGEFFGSAPEAYVDKPIEPAVLRETVNRLLKQSGAVR